MATGWGYFIFKQAIREEKEKIKKASALPYNDDDLLIGDYGHALKFYMPSWLLIAVSCEDNERLDWGAVIEENKITLPTGQIINFDNKGKITNVKLQDKFISHNEFMNNITSVVFDKQCKIISDNIMDNERESNITLICWNPIYEYQEQTRIGCVEYQKYLFIVGLNFIEQTDNCDDECDMGLDQKLFMSAMELFVLRNQAEIDVVDVCRPWGTYDFTKTKDVVFFIDYVKNPENIISEKAFIYTLEEVIDDWYDFDDDFDDEEEIEEDDEETGSEIE